MVASASVNMVGNISAKGFTRLQLHGQSQQRTLSTLIDFPPELKSEIFQYLPGPSLAALQGNHSQLAHEARILLYAFPNFTSTFRLAQFAYTITQCPSYAKLVHKIDLSPLPDHGKIARAEELLAIEQTKRAERKVEEVLVRAKSQNKFIPSFMFTRPLSFAQLHRELYSRNPISSELDEVAIPPKPNPPHPNRNHYYFNLLHEAIKIPIGFLFHILTSCTNLRQLCISNIGWDTDYHTQSYLRDCNFSQHHWDYLFTFHPRKRSRREARAHEEHLAILREDLLGAVLRMGDLRVLGLEGCKWIPAEQMEKLVTMCEGRGGSVKADS